MVSRRYSSQWVQAILARTASTASLSWALARRITPWSAAGFSFHCSVAPCSVFFQGYDDDIKDPFAEEDVAERKAWNNFVQSIRSKLTVKQVVDGVRNGAECSFDYLTLVLTADMVAAVGLVENNSVNIVAAMLISPLMGPIMAVTFGTIISDRKLQKIGLRSEFIGLMISLLFGYVFGCLVGCTEDPWGNGDWPTEEMKGSKT
ncbi:hypothetical protein PR048_000062 [Dryococelus australis]|uniref:Uncharacterized protein n=1 Tax=Dryococelus australis TaxID=614101 RepID=A0ABQ9IDK4_9NEOP|nr:hypothetical protein PR048_000062 [Dryococelus australis]